MIDNILTDQQLKDADTETRRWWARVYLLMNASACTLEYAIQAVLCTDRNAPNETSLHHPHSADLPDGDRRISHRSALHRTAAR